MNYYLDTEFYEDGERIHLISIGIVSEGGSVLYFENSEFDWSIVPADHWIMANVRPKLQGGAFLVSRKYMAIEIETFCANATAFYAYYADYDWIAFCQLFGTMRALPPSFPKYCRDLKQTMAMFGLGAEWAATMCPQQSEHHAIDDAMWNRMLHNELQRFALYSNFKSAKLNV